MKISADDLNEFPKRKRALFVNSLSGFKSCNLVGTIDKNQKTNLCIISSAFHLGADPALMGFVIRPDSVPRHTLENIRSTKAFTLNHVHIDIFEKAHQTSARYPKDDSEFEKCNLQEEFHPPFIAPFVKESFLKMSFFLKSEIPIDLNGVHIIIGQLQDVYLPEKSLHEDGFIDIEALNTICVSSLDSYHQTKRISRLSYAKPDQPIRKI